ncbi:hypothetical protein BDV96DRAFT_202837 [Lophiotrema nucula]|uniref:RING-type domain-containing protein n=1 Tax=Lophiotrema nucula TaxID=690887 RepID=A0A6A5YU22_9PLEO|nr:hypothetical protein BDV96DRAFT_202837 [Lophiotrema nucula]
MAPIYARNRSESSFILFTTPLEVGKIDPYSRDCPICNEPYGTYSKAIDLSSNDDLLEWPVRVDLCATPDSRTRLCGHIFGRRCLEKHLKAQGPWHSKCPMCRMTWFEPVHSGVNIGPAFWSPREGSSRNDEEIGEPPQAQDTDEEAAKQEQEQTTPRDRLRRRRPTPFLRRVLEACNVEEGSDEVRGSVDDVERTLEQLYAGREQWAEVQQ